MAKKFVSDEKQRMVEMQKHYDAQKAKSFSYKFDDFEIVGGCWKHKNWKTWMKGGNGFAETKKIVLNYIKECKKPYGTRNLTMFHLA